MYAEIYFTSFSALVVNARTSWCFGAAAWEFSCALYPDRESEPDGLVYGSVYRTLNWISVTRTFRDAEATPT